MLVSRVLRVRKEDTPFISSQIIGHSQYIIIFILLHFLDYHYLDGVFPYFSHLITIFPCVSAFAFSFHYPSFHIFIVTVRQVYRCLCVSLRFHAISFLFFSLPLYFALPVFLFLVEEMAAVLPFLGFRIQISPNLIRILSKVGISLLL